MEKAERSKNEYNITAIDNDKKSICENFAMSIFARADEDDRSENITSNTAKTYYAASTFFDILEQFGDLDEEVIEKRKYSKWRAAEILRALKEGRSPAAPVS